MGDRPPSPRARAPEAGTRVLYILPLKALAIDVERNLRTPLAGISRIAEQSGYCQPAPTISVGVRPVTLPWPPRQLIFSIRPTS